MDHQIVVRAEVVSTIPLTRDDTAVLQQKLGVATGRTVRMETRVDPSILGGLVARVGTVVYDGSIATQLAKMRERLSENR
jgi:F-type H+-transporting ATPase subunit delta